MNIVERVREVARSCTFEDSSEYGTLMQAADEIERLRAELDAFRECGFTLEPIDGRHPGGRRPIELTLYYRPDQYTP